MGLSRNSITNFEFLASKSSATLLPTLGTLTMQGREGQNGNDNGRKKLSLVLSFRQR